MKTNRVGNKQRLQPTEKFSNNEAHLISVVSFQSLKIILWTNPYDPTNPKITSSRRTEAQSGRPIACVELGNTCRGTLKLVGIKIIINITQN